MFGGMNKKGGLFNAMSGITSKMSDTLNTAVKEVSAVAQHANVAAQQTTKAATAKAAAAAKSAGVVPPAAAQKAPTPPTAQPKPSAPMTPRTLTKQESVRSDKMPGDEAERRSLATLPEVSDPAYQSDSQDQVRVAAGSTLYGKREERKLLMFSLSPSFGCAFHTVNVHQFLGNSSKIKCRFSLYKAFTGTITF